MPMPYSPDAVAALRHAAASHTPIAEVQQLLGWDGAMLMRVCRKHGIAIIGALPAAAPIERPPQRVGMKDRLRAFAGTLNGASGVMLIRLTRRPIGEVVPSSELGIDNRASASSCRNRINKLLEAAGLPWGVEGVQRGHDDSGYRLVRMFSLTWKKKTTPAGRPIFRLQASALDASGSAYGSLPTPAKRDGRTLKGSQPPKRNLGIFVGRLNPMKVGSLMGYPPKVTLLRPTAMRSSRKSQQNLSAPQAEPDS